MANITFQGQALQTCGELPAVGTPAPELKLTKIDLSDVTLADFAGKRVVLNIFPSVDTDVCATSVRKFNELASSMDNTVVLCISKDLPFAHARFCGAEGLDNVVSLSDFRSPEFVKNYGVPICDGPLGGLMSRAVIVINEAGSVIYTEQVSEVTQEPDYDKALESLKQ